jgi:DNA repair exonuclease SbcCD ATPase subunit
MMKELLPALLGSLGLLVFVISFFGLLVRVIIRKGPEKKKWGLVLLGSFMTFIVAVAISPTPSSKTQLSGNAISPTGQSVQAGNISTSTIILAVVVTALAGCYVISAYYKKKLNKLNEEYNKLKPYETIVDAEKRAEEIIKEAEEEADDIQNEADDLLETAKNKLEDATKRLRTAIGDGQRQAQRLIEDAEKRAEEIAGDALEAKRNADHYERTVTAMKNIIHGYGNEYIIPSRSLLDDLADTYGYTQAGEGFKQARIYSKNLIKNNNAAKCEYAEAFRAMNAINFVVDAFNGKVDSILSRAKTDNFGKLKQEMIDAFHIVNNNGKAFRDARITDEYFNSRLSELKLACTMQEIRQRDLEEQRRIKEQAREEEKARKEIEKAMRDAAKEEDMLQKAMDKARAQLEQASEEQRATYEAQIAELEKKWKEAEERNQRAKSMAEQTKSGNVYIISNIGSFGENVYKIGMTRRVEPEERIRELGDASVPFPFDIHAMIWSNDAPSLETELHRKFAIAQVNKVNYRKEFFSIPLSEIREIIEKDNIETKWTMTAEAREYRETLAINERIKNDPSVHDEWMKGLIETTGKPSLQLINADEADDYDDE